VSRVDLSGCYRCQNHWGTSSCHSASPEAWKWWDTHITPPSHYSPFSFVLFLCVWTTPRKRNPLSLCSQPPPTTYRTQQLVSQSHTHKFSRWRVVYRGPPPLRLGEKDPVVDCRRKVGDRVWTSQASDGALGQWRGSRRCVLVHPTQVSARIRSVVHRAPPRGRQPQSTDPPPSSMTSLLTCGPRPVPPVCLRRIDAGSWPSPDLIASIFLNRGGGGTGSASRRRLDDKWDFFLEFRVSSNRGNFCGNRTQRKWSIYERNCARN
jgi:hypothetical protein